MEDHRDPGTNRLRPHYHRQQAEHPPKRLQSDIVRDYRDDIIGLIRDDGASLAEVISAVAAQGELVLPPGFKAEVLALIGPVKKIRAGLVKPLNLPRRAASQASTASVDDQATNSARPLGEDDDEANPFASRQSRG